MRHRSSYAVYRELMHGFTLVELLVVISIIGLLLSILMPVIQRARQAGQAVICRSNLRTIALSEFMYASDFDDYLAPTRGDRGADRYGFYWAALLWSNYNKTQIPNYGDTNRKSIEKPAWLACPSEKYRNVDAYCKYYDGASPYLWHDVLLVPRGSIGKWWLKNICYSRNSSGQGWIQTGVEGYSCMKRTSMRNPSSVIANADGRYIHFPSIQLAKKYWPDGRVNLPIYVGDGMLVFNYRHASAKKVNILLWDGHVEDVGSDDDLESYRISPEGR